MKLSVDSKQRLMTGFLFLLEFYKVLMGTFLGAFVPLKCADKICSVRDNITSDDPYHVITNIYNTVSFILVIAFYYVEIKRENWSIEYLDIDESKPNNYLDNEIERYPKYKKEMRSLNNTYLKATRVAIFMLVSNFIVSGFLVGFNYYNINTLNSILSFFMLVFMKLSKAHGIAYRSLSDEQVCSGYLVSPKVYNTIDEDYRLTDIGYVDRHEGVKIEITETKSDNLTSIQDESL